MKKDFFKIKYLSKNEIIKNIFIGALYYFVLGYIFFRSLPISLCFMIFSFYYLKKADKRKGDELKIQLRGQFKEAIYALTSSISGGKSIERAFINSFVDLREIYEDDALIIYYWGEIVKKIEMNIPIEDCLLDFAKEAELEEISSFSSIFALSKKLGGNLVEIIKSSTATINEKIELTNELAVLVAKKQYEQRILAVIIPAMILLFNVFSPEFLAPLYGNLKGQVIMLFSLCAYLFSKVLGEKIVDIRV